MNNLALTWLWPWLALGFSFAGALLIGFNQAARLEGNKAVVWRLCGILPLAFLSEFFLPLPTDFGVYIGAATLGVVMAFADVRLYRVSAVFGARLAALYMPLKIALGFTLWSLIEPSSLGPLLQSPLRFLMVIAAFGLGWEALTRIRRNDISKLAMKAILPAAALLAAADILAKLCLPVNVDTTIPGILGRAVTVLTIAALSSAGVIIWRQVQFSPQTGLASFRPTSKQIIQGMGLGVLHLGSLSILLLAIALAPNPGYVGSLSILSAVWLALYARAFHHEKNNLWAILLLVFAGGTVAWATAFW